MTDRGHVRYSLAFWLFLLAIPLSLAAVLLLARLFPSPPAEERPAAGQEGKHA